MATHHIFPPLACGAICGFTFEETKWYIPQLYTNPEHPLDILDLVFIGDSDKLNVGSLSLLLYSHCSIVLSNKDEVIHTGPRYVDII